MLKSVARQLPRARAPHILSKTAQAQRLLSTAPPHKTSRSWKSSGLRWGIAGSLVYFYNTSNAFAEEPKYALHAPPETQQESETLPTLEEIAAQKRSQRQSAATVATSTPPVDDVAAPGSPDELEEEASEQGAFNEETGEINWDCPCLGGMANGPCGEEFRAAFSCFVYSKEEPKGVECIDRFKGMQECFRQHPDVYGAELDDEEAEAAPGDAGSPASSEPSAPEASSPPSLSNIDSPHGKGEKVAEHKPQLQPDSPQEVQAKRERSQAAKAQVDSEHGAVSESEEMVPKAWHDAK